MAQVPTTTRTDQAADAQLSQRLEASRARLANLNDLSLPTDYPRPVPNHTVEAELRRSISDRTARAILKLALLAADDSSNADAVSPFHILLTAFSVLLHKYTAEEDLTIGSSSQSTNPLVLRLNVLDQDPFITVLHSIIKAEIEAARDEVPFGLLLEALFPSKTNADASASDDNTIPSLFRVRFFNLTDTSAETFASSTTSSTCDITILISQSTTLRRLLPIDITVLYNTVIFSASRITDMLDQLELVLDTAAKTPSQPIGAISVVTESSKAHLPDPTADLHWSGFEGAITDIFANRAALHPDRTCIVESTTGGAARHFSYKTIHEASNVLAHHLMKQGIVREDVVVLYSYRGVDLVVAVMGVLKAGATFSVIDPAYPPNRQIIYLSVAQPRGLVVLRKAGELHSDVTTYVKENLPQCGCFVPSLELMDDGVINGGTLGSAGDILDSARNRKGEVTGVALGPDSIGTLSFTSGSTGIPKGVRGRHFSLTHFYPWMRGEFKMNEEERFTMLSGIAHDPIQRDIFTPIFLGAQLRIPTAEDIGSPGRLAEWMAENEITVTHLTPAMGQLLSANAVTPIHSLRNAFFVGDVLTKRDVTRLQFLAPNVHIINMYGTTETQRAVSYLTIPPPSVNVGFLSVQKDIMPAGKGMMDVQLLIINASGLLCGVGEVGEIYVRSSGLAEGYLRLDDVTAQKFISNPFNPSFNANDSSLLRHYKGARDRMYRTGDLGRYRSDGSVECTGRADDQVKIRGFRIELGEIDTHLSQHPKVRENVTLVRRDKFEEPTLCSYFVPLGDLRPEDVANLIKDIREYLKLKLPSYAVPAVFAPLIRMPLTPNGKVDKNALPFPDTAMAGLLISSTLSRSNSAASVVLTPVQSAIRDVWASLLGKPPSSISLDDNFFDLGGHSILATRLVFSIRKALAVEVPLGLMYQEPTIGGMAIEIEKIRGSDLNIATGQGSTAFLHGTDEPGGASGGIVGEEFDYAADLDVVDDPSIAAKSLAAFEFKDPRKQQVTYLLTGATGFLGAFILSSLLKVSKTTKVVCLVRAKDETQGLARLKANGEKHLVWDEDGWVGSGRVSVKIGDLAEERLGLSMDDWEALSKDIDVVVHNGALVHWIYPYHKLRAANVIGTVWGLRLCTTNRLKSFHFVSSTSALDTRHYVHRFLDLGKGVPESDDLEGARKGLRSGYGQTKWVAEAVVARARSRGVPATIVRPGYIVGDSHTGVSNTDDFLWRLVKGCIQLGMVPRISNIVNMCPVDYVADSVAAIASSEAALSVDNGVFHMWHPHRFRFDDLFEQLSTHGYNVTPTEYIAWRSALMDLTLSSPAASPANNSASSQEEDHPHALFPLLHFVVDDLPTSTRSPELDDCNARQILEPAGISCPDVRSLMSVYLGYFIETGFLEEPSTIQFDSQVGSRGQMKSIPRLEIWDLIKGRGVVGRTGA